MTCGCSYGYAPVVGVLVLLAAGAADGQTLRLGIAGDKYLKPYGIVILFMSQVMHLHCRDAVHKRCGVAATVVSGHRVKHVIWHEVNISFDEHAPFARVTNSTSFHILAGVSVHIPGCHWHICIRGGSGHSDSRHRRPQSGAALNPASSRPQWLTTSSAAWEDVCKRWP